MGLLSAGAFLSYFGASALPFLVALYLGEHLGLPPDLVGVALLGYGVAGLALGSVWGRVTDRIGARTCGAVGAVLTGLFVGLVGTTRSPLVLTVLWTTAGAAASMLTVALQNLTVRAV